MRNISAWSIRNPVAPLVVFAMLTLAGLIAFFTLDVNNNPDVDFPGATVTVVQPGAAPTELETQVTQRVEAAIRGINGVEDITSYVSEGQSNTNVTFAIGTPVDRAVNDVRDAVANIRSDLPQGILQPTIRRIDVGGGGPIAYISAEATDMTLEELSWFVDNEVAKKLLAVPGMAAVQRGGGVNREIRVILDPARMQAYGLTASQVNAQLRQVNLNAAGGRAEVAGSEQAVRVLGNARNAYALSQTEISTGNGRRIKLADVATVKDLYAEQRSLSKMNGRQVLSFSLQKSRGASDVAVHDAAMKVLDEVAAENPKVKFRQLFTTVDYTREQFDSALHAMIEGAILAVIVVFIFLRDWRATVISALAIPLSAIPTFWFMELLGFSLNSLSLLALSLVAGVLVDDAIVEIENIVRHMRMGKSAYQASIDAADEIGLAVVATTFSIVAVFLPVGLMPGISGEFFKNFGFTVVAAVLLSLAVARLITPMMAAYFLKSEGAKPHGDAKWVDWYMALLRWSLANRWKTVAIGALALVATVVSFATLPLTFQPNIDSDYSQVTIQMTPGTTLQQTEAVADRVSAMLRESPVVEAAFADVEVGSANIYLTLKKQRDQKSTEFERSFAPRLQEVADARVNFQSQSGGGGGRDMSVMLAGNDPVLLETTAARLVEEMRGLKELRAPRIEGDLRRPEIVVRPRFDLAADLGVTTAALSETIRIATLGEIDQNAAKFSLNDRQVPIRVALAEDSRRSIATIENLPVPTARGGTVPLKLVADVGFGTGPTVIRRYNQQRRVLVGADLAPGLVTGDAQPKINALPTMKALPQGVERVSFGMDKWQGELIQNFIFAVIAGVVLVFATLVLLYKRILPPFVNMGSLLLAPLGGAIALHLTGNAVSMPVFIGLLMLLGIVAKNSILLVDMAIEEMGKGVAKFDAIMEAGHKRVQPIVMTTVAMVAGMMPIALALTGDGSWRAPMGIVVIGGLIMSTALTLVIVPAGFSLAVSAEERLGPWLKRVFTNNEPGETVPKPLASPSPAE